MADNRMYLRCRGCGKELYLGKRLGVGYYWENYGKLNNEHHVNDPNWAKQDERSLEDRLNQFYEDHEWCEGAGLDCFELIYEVPPKPFSNADHIRSMTDEELAEWITELTDCAVYPYTQKDAPCVSIGQTCAASWLDWLKQESEK